MERALVIGASGYIGSHLVPSLAEHGYRVRAAARHREVLEDRGWSGVELFEADALRPETLPPALSDIDVAYYLIHSMASGRGFPALDRRAADNFRRAAEAAGIRRIIYLGGLLPRGEASSHLASRRDTGERLRGGSVPVTEVRAGIVVGAGSAAFEVIRDLVYHLPVMVTPRWVRARAQPIALDDLLEYLARLPNTEQTENRIFEVGGPDVLTYETLIREFARVVGKHPLIIPVPLLTPRLSALWLELITAVPVNVARALVEGLRHDIVADTGPIRQAIPIPLKGYREAVETALRQEQAGRVPARWTEGAFAFRDYRPDIAYYAKTLTAEAVAHAPAERVWKEVMRVGGANGWYAMGRLWQLRGLIDAVAGGVGRRRGRRDPELLRVGDTVDYWRVVALEPGRRLTLVAELKQPGSAVLEFVVSGKAPVLSVLRVTSHFHPAGLWGIGYWYALRPVLRRLCDGLARAITERAADGGEEGV